MTGVILDASAVLAFLRREPGAERVEPRLPGARMSAVNHAEVLQKGIETGATMDDVRSAVALLQLEIVPFDAEQAALAAALWPRVRPKGLSLADRCALALALRLERPVLTADREWGRLEIGVEIEVIR